MIKKQIFTTVIVFFLISMLVGCSGINKATKNLEDEGYTLEENQDFLDGIDDEDLEYIEAGYIIYDEHDNIIGSIIEFNSRSDLREYVENYATEEELEESKDNFYRDLFIIANDEIITIIKN